MRARRLVAVLSVAAGISVAPAAAAVAATPAVSWTMSSTHVTASAAHGITITYRMSDAPAHGTLVLQRHTGSRPFRTLRTLQANTARGDGATGTLPIASPPRGRFRYRIALLNHLLVPVATGRTYTVYSYAPVQLATVAGGYAGTAPVADRQFQYVGSGTSGLNRSFTTSTCRSVSVQAAFENQASILSSGTVTVKQGAHTDGTMAVTGAATFANATFAITPGDFDVYLQSAGSDAIFYSGTLSCWTASAN